LRALLNEIGYADALLVRQLPDGRLMLFDGHLRAETTPDALVPVLVLDVNEEEADKLLLTLDPLAAMAEADAERISQLLATVRTEDPAIEQLLAKGSGKFSIRMRFRKRRFHSIERARSAKNGALAAVSCGGSARIACYVGILGNTAISSACTAAKSFA